MLVLPRFWTASCMNNGFATVLQLIAESTNNIMVAARACLFFLERINNENNIAPAQKVTYSQSVVI